MTEPLRRRLHNCWLTKRLPVSTQRKKRKNNLGRALPPRSLPCFGTCWPRSHKRPASSSRRWRRGDGGGALPARAGDRPIRQRVSDVRRGPRRTARENRAGLTARELDVLALLAEGLRNAQIAERLVVSERTVDHRVSAIPRKLDVGTCGEAAAESTRRQLLELSFSYAVSAR